MGTIVSPNKNTNHLFLHHTVLNCSLRRCWACLKQLLHVNRSIHPLLHHSELFRNYTVCEAFGGGRSGGLPLAAKGGIPSLLLGSSALVPPCHHSSHYCRTCSNNNGEHSIYAYMGGCQNYGPFWIPIIIRHPICMVPQKGVIMLTTTHIYVSEPAKL